MRKNWVHVLLGASLLLNVMAIGGFVYVRHYALFRLNINAVSRRLDLDAAGRERLVQFRRDAWDAVMDSRQDSRAVMGEINAALAGKPVGDPAIASALDHLSAVRRQRQEKLVQLVIGFRDSLPPESRERFTAMSHDPGFVLELMGLHLGEAAP